MSARSREYFQNYYQNISRPKTLANRALAAAACQICGDHWATTHAGWNSAIFVCVYCDNKLSNWDREKEMARRKWEASCQFCSVEPAESLHEASQLRCCVGCSAWLSEEEAEGRQLWEPAKANPWDEDDGRLGHLFELGTQFHEPPAATALCGVKALVAPVVMDMETPAAVRRWGICFACMKLCPEPVGISHSDRGNYFAYVIPVGQGQEIALAVGTS